MTLMPMASVMAVTEPKWASIWGRFLWVMLLSMVLGSLLALLLPLGAVEEQCLALLKGFYLLSSKLDRAQHAVTRYTRPSTELSVTSKDAALLVVKTKSSPGKTEWLFLLNSWFFCFVWIMPHLIYLLSFVFFTFVKIIGVTLVSNKFSV